jgi:hypothetical protein
VVNAQIKPAARALSGPTALGGNGGDSSIGSDSHTSADRTPAPPNKRAGQTMPNERDNHQERR